MIVCTGAANLPPEAAGEASLGNGHSQSVTLGIQSCCTGGPQRPGAEEAAPACEFLGGMGAVWAAAFLAASRSLRHLTAGISTGFPGTSTVEIDFSCCDFSVLDWEYDEFRSSLTVCSLELRRLQNLEHSAVFNKH